MAKWSMSRKTGARLRNRPGFFTELQNFLVRAANQCGHQSPYSLSVTFWKGDLVRAEVGYSDGATQTLTVDENKLTEIVNFATGLTKVTRWGFTPRGVEIVLIFDDRSTVTINGGGVEVSKKPKPYKPKKSRPPKPWKPPEPRDKAEFVFRYVGIPAFRLYILLRLERQLPKPKSAKAARARALLAEARVWKPNENENEIIWVVFPHKSITSEFVICHGGSSTDSVLRVGPRSMAASDQ